MASRKPKSAALLAVPQSREEAAAGVARVGELRRFIAGKKAEADAVIQQAGEDFERATAQAAAELAETERGVQVWCEANRGTLTGRVKFHEFGTGRVLWRSRPPRVTLRGVEAVIAACKAVGATDFVRVREEPNKEAMLADPERAGAIAGVTIASEGEDFVIEPAEMTSASAKA